MLGIQGDITKESVNEAFKNLKAFSSDLWCKPWYFDSTVGSNVSNNNGHHRHAAGRQDGADRGLLRDAELDANPLAQIRAKEQELGLERLTSPTRALRSCAHCVHIASTSQEG